MNSSRKNTIKLATLMVGLTMLAGCVSIPAKATKLSKTTSCNTNRPSASLSTYSQQIERADYQQDAQTLATLKASLEQNLACNPHPGKYLYYYLGYVNYVLADVLFDDTGKATRDIDAAEQMLTTAIKIDPSFAEAVALLGSSYGVEIALHPLKGIFLGHESTTFVEHALQLDPENPRVALLKAINDYSTPGLFGGDKKLATKEFRKSLALFDSYKPADADAPNWGRAEAYFWLAHAQAGVGDVQQARSNYQAALATEPGYRAAKAGLAKLDSNPGSE